MLFRKLNRFLLILPLTLIIAQPLFSARAKLLPQYKATEKISWAQEIQWDWSAIDEMEDAEFWQSLSFDKDFMWGVATSAFQIEGTQTANGQHCNNSWTVNGERLPQPGVACDHWNRYKQDVQLIKNLGINSYRFSIEWSKVEPAEGVFDEAALQHYVDLVNELNRNGIKPIPCLFHHAWPQWFEEKGAFERAENIDDFVEFAEHVFEKLNDKAPMWMTFNEPVGYALEGYFRGNYPPFKKSLKLCGVVVQNMLNAHVAVYQRFKEINPDVQVGFPKIFQPLDNYHSWNPLEKLVCTLFNYLLHDVALNFFATGHFSWGKMVTGYNPLAPQSLDFLGINYYTHTLLKNTMWPFKLGLAQRASDKITGSGRVMYPEGLYRAIQKAAAVLPEVPLHIGENGVNDPDGIWQNEFIKKHLFVVRKAIQDGYNICGYFWWTLMDSFSWKSGEDSKMGFYELNFDTQERTLRESAKPFVEFLHRDQVTYLI